ncbi:MAG: hypothetical protein HRU75_08875 [Planctomycetia bacterium]|nr:MAG: hypothetical protein HRU75_08875 [Planctomycetia bacterium]
MRTHARTRTRSAVAAISRTRRSWCIRTRLFAVVTAGVTAVGLASPVWAQLPLPTTLSDFHVPGTQVGDVSPSVMLSPSDCRNCHGNFDAQNDPYATWRGSLMSHAGRDPLFYAQMSLANQDTQNVGYYCLRCHVPQSIVTGHANQPDGSTLNAHDRRGVDCHFCHAMVDPIYNPGVSPPEDQAILAALAAIPQHFGNAMFVLDPDATRRSGRPDPAAPHEFLESPFHRTGAFCGTCHDVGNVAVTRQPDGSYAYNTLGAPSPTSDPWMQYPLERTYTEWKLSAFNQGGVDMGGRFGGTIGPVIRTCQDCHMPAAAAKSCFFGPTHPDTRRHDFAGASAQVLDLVLEVFGDDPDVDAASIGVARAKAVSMLQRAASLELAQDCRRLRVRTINETGHKLPTGHIEGRRVWVHVRFLNGQDALLREHGGYDYADAELDERSTVVYEMFVGLSEAAAIATGLPAGFTTHMALADTIWKDNRIPPRGFSNAAFEAGGAPVVGHNYADGQHWDDAYFAAPHRAARAEVTIYYQNTPRSYIEHLRDANHTDDWGEILHSAWVATGRGAPIAMVSGVLALTPGLPGDMNCDCAVNNFDIDPFVEALVNPEAYAAAHADCDLLAADVDGDGLVTNFDIDPFVQLLISP